MATAEEYAADNARALAELDDASVLAYYASLVRDPGEDMWGPVFTQQAKAEIMKRMEK